MNFEKKLEEQILKIISSWDDTEIYAISFLLTSNQLSIYQGIPNFPEFSVGYNTENDCGRAELLSEERWNFAYWSQNNTTIIDTNHTDMANGLIQWYKDNNVVNIGFESEDEMYDEKFNYIGKGPSGYWELSSLISNIARKIQEDGEIKKRFGNIPIIIHGLEYCWYTANMTDNANPNGEAKIFLKYLLSLSEDTSD